MSESLSGATLLALGNGSPDLFATFSAMGSAAEGLAIGELVGSALFITCLTVGTVAYLCPFQLERHLLFRDGGFLWGALALNFFVLWDNKITLLESFILISYYLLYVGAITYSDFSKSTDAATSSPSVLSPLLPVSPSPEDTVPMIEQDHVTDFTGHLYKTTQAGRRKLGVLDTVAFYEQLHPESNVELELLHVPMSPESVEPSPVLKTLLFPFTKITPHRPPLEKCFLYLISPFYAFLRISIPVATLPHPSHSMFDTATSYLPLNTLQAFFGTFLTCMAVYDVLEIDWTLWHFLMATFFSALVASIYLFLQVSQVLAKNDTFIGWGGFAVAMAWIYLIANEVVVILRIFGFLFNISDSIVGLTFFAMGNSLGDFVTNITMAKMGFPIMAVTACFATPMLNLILGVGFSTAWNTIRSKHPITPILGSCIHIAGGGLLVVITMYFLIVPFKNYRFDEAFGLFLMLLYFVILAASLII